MTKREFYEQFLSGQSTDEMRQFIRNELAALNERNASRAAKVKEKRATADAPMIAEIRKRGSSTMPTLASEVAAALGVSTPKATALLRSLVASGEFTVRDYKINNKGRTVKAYFAAPTAADEPTPDHVIVVD